MANEEHKQLLLQGVNQWNTWRRENYDLDLTPDLSNIDLYKSTLIGVNFANTNLTGTNLAFANLGGANLVRANLTDANLQRGNFIEANLSQANLTRANLIEAIFVETLVGKTDFMNAVMARTVFANLDLRESKNLDTITHKEKSTLGIDTIMRSKGALPGEFLQGAGLTERLITFLASLDYSSVKRQTTNEKYYTSGTDSEGEIIYVFMDTSKSFDQMLRWTKEAPSGDAKTIEPYYLDPPTFWDKVSDAYTDSR